MIIPGAEPFFIPGGATGCLLVHGFTGTPFEMHDLGNYLAAQGMSVLGVRLTGHATRKEDMPRTRWTDWLASVEDGYHLLSGVTDRILAIGVSLGGILSLTFASGRYTPNCPITGVVAIASPYQVPINPWLIRFSRFISPVMPYRAKSPSDWYDQQAEQSHISYNADPIRSGYEVHLLTNEMHACLPMITVPALLIYSKDDQTVRPEDHHAERIYSELGSKQKQLVWIDHCGHNLTRDAECETVFALVENFVLAATMQPV
jgi:carboxylesterase